MGRPGPRKPCLIGELCRIESPNCEGSGGGGGGGGGEGSGGRSGSGGERRSRRTSRRNVESRSRSRTRHLIVDILGAAEAAENTAKFVIVVVVPL